MSPKPTVAIVTTAQYMLVGMLLKPYCGPSMTYSSAPAMIAMVTTIDRNSRILRRLRHNACISSPLSSM
ncbi:hypothetical protein D3C81_796920 [compost metagenome]